MSDDKNEEKPAEEDVCKKCRHWRPTVVTDSLGMIRGADYCFRRDRRPDHGCFDEQEEPVGATGDEEEAAK